MKKNYILSICNMEYASYEILGMPELHKGKKRAYLRQVDLHGTIQGTYRQEPRNLVPALRCKRRDEKFQD